MPPRCNCNPYRRRSSQSSLRSGPCTTSPTAVASPVRKQYVFSFLCLPFCKTVAEKTEHLPRQARDRHRESWKRDVMFLQAAICGGRQRLGAAATQRNVSLAATRVARQSPTAASARRASRGRSRRRQSRAFLDTRMLCTRSSHSGEERTHNKPKQDKAAHRH
eukprot:COSAG06_NODE_1262_length_10069_cov_2.923972_4_plen_163_part_00